MVLQIESQDGNMTEEEQKERFEEMILSKFLAKFPCDKIVKDSITWRISQRRSILEDKAREEKKLSKGGLTTEEKEQIRQNIEEYEALILDSDPAKIPNEVFDKWLASSGIRDYTYSDNEARGHNKSRLNRIMAKRKMKFVLTSEGKKGAIYVRDRFDYLQFCLRRIEPRKKTSIVNMTKEVRKQIEIAEEIYDLPEAFVARLDSPLEALAMDQENEMSEQKQLIKVLGNNPELLEYHRQKLLEY